MAEANVDLSFHRGCRFSDIVVVAVAVVVAVVAVAVTVAAAVVVGVTLVVRAAPHRMSSAVNHFLKTSVF